MADKTPADLISGNASDTSVIHASQNDDSNNSKKHNERDISRLQSASKSYSDTQTYKIGDIVTFENVIYRCIQAVTVPEIFDSSKWKRVIKPFIQFMMSNNDSFVTVQKRFFSANAGSPNQFPTFTDRASPIPIDIRLDQFRVSISSNNGIFIERRNWDLMIGDDKGENEQVAATIDIRGGITGEFKNIEDQVLVLAGQTIAYQLIEISGSFDVTVTGSSCRVT